VSELFANIKGPEFSGGILDWANKINNVGRRKWADPCSRGLAP